MSPSPDARGALLADLDVFLHDLFRRDEGPDARAMLVRCREAIAAGPKGPTWEPSSGVYLTLAQAEDLLADHDGRPTRDAQGAVAALRHGVECSRVRCEIPPRTP
jgi:hypothetical protein